MELKPNYYYSFKPENYWFWYKVYAEEQGLPVFRYEKLALEAGLPLKYLGNSRVNGEMQQWFDVYSPSLHMTVSGEIGLLWRDSLDNQLTELFTAFTLYELLPNHIKDDLEELRKAINRSDFNKFINLVKIYHMGKSEKLLFTVKSCEEVGGAGTSGEEVPEFSFEIEVNESEIRLTIYNQDASWGDSEFSELTFNEEGAGKANRDWEANKNLLIDRLKLHKNQVIGECTSYEQ